MKLKEFLKKWCEPNTTDESVIQQFNDDLKKLVIPYDVNLDIGESYECKKHKADLPCVECQRESEHEYDEGLAEHEESEKAKQMAQEQIEYEREQEFLNEGEHE
ncbi:MAG: hypothetical protein AABY22_06015 [Nanoarchaeota archaeon]